MFFCKYLTKNAFKTPSKPTTNLNEEKQERRKFKVPRRKLNTKEKLNFNHVVSILVCSCLRQICFLSYNLNKKKVYH